jgi:spermidine/putrescine transport system permease protein
MTLALTTPTATRDRRSVSDRLFAVVWRLPLLIWQSAFFVGPLIFLVIMSFWVVNNYRMEPAFEFVNWERIYTRPFFWDALVRTLWMSALATMITSLLAFPAAFAIAFRLSPRARRIALFLLIIPFFTSYLVRTYAWQVIIADNGVVNAALSSLGLGRYPMLNNLFGSMVGYLTLCLPLAVILQAWSLAAIDRRLIEAAWNLGCPPLRTLFSVILPLARTGFVVAAVFCFILSFGDFVAPYYLGGSKPPTLSILIVDTAKSGQQWPRSAVVALTMIVILLAVSLAGLSLAYGRRK